MKVRGEHRGGKGPGLKGQVLSRVSQTGMNQGGDVHVRTLCQPSYPEATFLKNLSSRSYFRIVVLVLILDPSDSVILKMMNGWLMERLFHREKLKELGESQNPPSHGSEWESGFLRPRENLEKLSEIEKKEEWRTPVVTSTFLRICDISSQFLCWPSFKLQEALLELIIFFSRIFQFCLNRTGFPEHCSFVGRVGTTSNNNGSSSF